MNNLDEFTYTFQFPNSGQGKELRYLCDAHWYSIIFCGYNKENVCFHIQKTLINVDPHLVSFVILFSTNVSVNEQHI